MSSSSVGEQVYYLNEAGFWGNLGTSIVNFTDMLVDGEDLGDWLAGNHHWSPFLDYSIGVRTSANSIFFIIIEVNLGGYIGIQT